MALLIHFFRCKKLTCTPVVYRRCLLSTNSYLRSNKFELVSKTKRYANVCAASTTLSSDLTSFNPITQQNKSFSTSNVKQQWYLPGKDHSRQWILERFVSSLLLFTIPAALYFQTELLDIFLVILISTHLYLGLETIVTDYIRESVFGRIIPQLAHAALVLVIIGMLYGMAYLTFYAGGLSSTVVSIWHAL